MFKLALTVAAIALADWVNPSLIGGELFVAIGPRPGRRVAAFTFAAWTVMFVFGLALALGLGDLILSVVPKPGATVKYALITAAGVALIVGAAVIWLRRKLLASSRPADRSHTSDGSPAMIGAGIAGVEMLTAFPFFAAIALIADSGVSNFGKLALLLLYTVVYSLPLIAIAVLFAVMGDRAERILQPVGAWLLARWPLIVAPLAATIGIAVTAFGVSQLA